MSEPTKPCHEDPAGDYAALAQQFTRMQKAWNEFAGKREQDLHNVTVQRDEAWQANKNSLHVIEQQDARCAALSEGMTGAVVAMGKVLGIVERECYGKPHHSEECIALNKALTTAQSALSPDSGNKFLVDLHQSGSSVYNLATETEGRDDRMSIPKLKHHSLEKAITRFAERMDRTVTCAPSQIDFARYGFIQGWNALRRQIKKQSRKET